ncbi:hypothetical protein PR202_gb14007 [Eleusine coracana subsp. coracana]|uniref:Choline transporter-like protein n=1 Tax=Eleusine coracana subsp. coracana TaxID=191504 RepID=A0AAV5DNZ5_ELECO|nr:hypothetical protein PR202_ga30990 [Eleusine coracana subsp. coracana]GJN26104.1 hypothetical protein PR202_gb14007 [Eleusine coracana subsp. coracana]
MALGGGPLGAIIGRYPSAFAAGEEDPGGSIIHHDRRCRDIPFLVLFAAFWVAMIVNSSFGFNQGDPLRLTYGLDYKGNICGSKHGDPDLRELDVRYWLNPNQVYQSGLKSSQINLPDAKAICLMECPLPAEDGLNFVCDYPEGDIRLTVNDWIDRDYDYFEYLTPEMRNSSLQLQGPCYPVIFPSVNVYWSCQFIARSSNVSLKHWEQMGGVSIDENMLIDKTIHNAINSKSAVLKEINHLHVAAVLMTAIMVIAFLTSIAIGRRILRATSVLKVAAKVTGEVQALIIFPIVPYFILAIFYMFCIHYTPHISIAIIFHLFGCYWATQFFIASSSTVIAGSVATYYWARGEVSHDIPFRTVISSMKRLLRYSLGSVALGSLIVSVMEWMRFILDSIRRRLKFVDSSHESFFGKTTIKSVNRNAYIMIAITGKGFCKASVLATGLIMNNILRIGKVNVIGDIILFLGKLCVSLFCALFAFLMLDEHKYRSAHNKISSPLFPVLLSWALGYIVAKLFFAVVEMSIDTIILSFCQDAEEHEGNAQYAPPLLMETLEEQNELQRLTHGP